MNEEQYQYVYNAYKANPYAFTNEQVDQIANAAKRLNVDFGRDSVHEEASIGSVLGNVLSGAIQGFTTLEVGDRPVTAADQIANNIGYLLGFVGFVPGVGTAGRFLTRTAVKNIVGKSASNTVLGQLGRQATVRTAAGLRSVTSGRISSVPFLIANRIIDGKTASKAAQSATDFFIKKGLEKQTASKIGDIAKEGLRMGVASSVSSWQYGIDQMASSFAQGTVTGGAFRGIANFVNLGSESANRFARIAADTVYSGGMSTLAGDPMPVQVYNYALGALFGSMEKPLKYYQAAEFINKNVNVHKDRFMRRKAVDDIHNLDEYKNLPKEVKDVVDHDTDIQYGSEAQIAEGLLGEDFVGKMRQGELVVNEAVRRYAAEKGIKPEEAVRTFASSQEYVRKVEESLEAGKTEGQAQADGREAAQQVRKEIDDLLMPMMYQGDPIAAGDFIPRLRAEEEAYKPSVGAFESTLSSLSRKSATPSEFFRRAELEVSKFFGSSTERVDLQTGEVLEGRRLILGDRPEDVELLRVRLNELDPTIKLTEADDKLLRQTMNTYKKVGEKLAAYVSKSGDLQYGKLTDSFQDIRETGDRTFFDYIGLPLALLKRISGRNNSAAASEIRVRYAAGDWPTPSPLAGLVDAISAMGKSPSPFMKFAFSPVKSKGQIALVPSLLGNMGDAIARKSALTEFNKTLGSLDAEHKGVKQEYIQARKRFVDEFSVLKRQSKVAGVSVSDYYDLNALNNIRTIEEINKSVDPNTGNPIYVPFAEMLRNPDRFISSSDELVKRMQGFADSNIVINAPYFESVRAGAEFETVVENGGFNYVILNDKRSDGGASFGELSSLGEKAGEITRIDNTDAALLMRADVFDAAANSAGLEDGIGSMKLTVTYGDELGPNGNPLGATFHKVSGIRLSEAESEQLAKNNIDYAVFASGVKQTGFRDAVDYKVGADGALSLSDAAKVYKAPLESVRVNVGASEHISQVNNAVRVVSQMADDISDPAVRQLLYDKVYRPSFEGSKKATASFLSGGFEGVDIDRVDMRELADVYYSSSSAYSPETRGFFIKEVLKKNLPDPENDYSIRAERENSRSMKILQDLIDTEYLGLGFGDLDKSVRDYVEDRVRAYFHARISKPMHDVGGQSIFTSTDAFTQHHLAALGNSAEYKNMSEKLKDSLKRGVLPQGWVVFNEGMKDQRIKWVDGKKVRLEDAFSDYLKETKPSKRKQMENLLTFLFVRVPNDSAAGVLPLKIAGFGQRSGSGMIVHGEELKRMGGADIDIDKAFWYQDIDGNGSGTGPIMDYFRSTKQAVAPEPFQKPAGKSKERKFASLFSPAWLQSDGARSHGSKGRIGVYANISKRIRNYLYDLSGNDRAALSAFNRWITEGINSSADGYNNEDASLIGVQARRRADEIAGEYGIGEALINSAKSIEDVFDRGKEGTVPERAAAAVADENTFNHPRHRGVIQLAEIINSNSAKADSADPAASFPSVSTSSVNRIIERFFKVFEGTDDQSRLTRFLIEGFGSPNKGGNNRSDTDAETITALGSMVALDRRGRAAIAEMQELGYTREEALVNIEAIQSSFKGDSGYIGRLSSVFKNKSRETAEEVFRDMTESAYQIEREYGSSTRLYFEMIARGGRRMSTTPTKGAIDMLRSIPESTIYNTIEKAKQAKVKNGKPEDVAREEAISELIEAARKQKDTIAKQAVAVNDWAGISKQTNIDYADAVTYVARGEDAIAERAAEPTIAETGGVKLTNDPETDLPPDPVSFKEAERAEELAGRIRGKELGAKFSPEDEAKIARFKEILHENSGLYEEIMAGGAGSIIKDSTGNPIAPELWTPRELDVFINYFNRSKSGGFLWDLFSKGTGDLPRLAYLYFPETVVNYVKPFDGKLEAAINKRIVTTSGIVDAPVREFFTGLDKQRAVFEYASDRQGRAAAKENEVLSNYLGFLEQEAFKGDASDILIVSTALRELGLIRKINDDGSLGGFKKNYQKTVVWKRFKNIEPIYKKLLDKTYIATIPKLNKDGSFARDEKGKILFTKELKKVTGKELFGQVDNPNSGAVNKSLTNILRDIYNSFVVNTKGADKHIIYKDRNLGIVDIDATIDGLFNMIRRGNEFNIGIDGVNRILHAQQIERLAVEVANRKFPTKRGSDRYNKIVENLYNRNPFEYENLDALDAGMTKLQTAASSKDKSVSIGQIGEINMFAYFPHNGVSQAIAGEYVKKLEQQLISATSDSERNRLKIRISQLYSTMAAPESAFTQSLRDMAFTTPRKANGELVIIKPKPTQSRGVEPMAGYDPSDAAIKTYIGQITKGYYDGISTIISNHEISRFEERKPFGDKTQEWAEWGRTYLRTVLGHDTMYSDEYLKKNPKLYKSAAYYASDRYYFDKYFETVVKRFDKERYDRVQKIKNETPAGEDWTRHPEVQRFASKIRSFSILEGKWNMSSLLANTRSLTNNIVGGNVMTLVSTGFRHWKNTFSSSYWKSINPDWKSKEDLYKFVAEHGAIEAYVINEVNLNPERFSGANVKNFLNEAISSISALYKQGKTLDDSDLRAIAKKNGLKEDFIQTAAWFMRSSERDLRMRSFMSHYFKAREVLGANKNIIAFNDPSLINFALKGVKGTQFLYNSAERPIFSSSSIGKIFSRFQLWSWNSIRFRRDVYKGAREIGYQEGTPEFERYKRVVTADLFMFGLASALPYTMFEAVVPAPFNYLQDLSDYFFGDEAEKEKAFFGTLPYPLNVTGIILPPSARIFQAMTTLAGGDVDRFINYHMYTMVPFGLMARNVARTATNPAYVVDNMTGVPVHRMGKYLRELRAEQPSREMASPFSFFSNESPAEE
jgi:hypothetical protein